MNVLNKTNTQPITLETKIELISICVKEKENGKHHHLQIVVSSSDVNTIKSVYEYNLWKLEKHIFV